jgi:hypothetical protein
VSDRGALERDRREAALALGRLESPDPVGLAGGADDGGRGDGGEASRAYLEVLGLLGAADPPHPPAADLRVRVLAAVRREARRGVVPFPRRVVGGAGAAAAAPSPAPPRWLVATAAALLAAVLGLGGYAGWLHQRLDTESLAVDRLARELADTRQRAAALARLQGAIERRNLRLSGELSLVASRGVEVCPLAPVGSAALPADAGGLLFLAPAGERWYLRLANLEPPPPGRVYRLWFLTTDGAMDGGALVVGAGDEISLAGRRLPAPERMRGAAVTLERAGGPPHRPTGPMLLFGDEKMAIL